jgi:hypothetical protein
MKTNTNSTNVQNGTNDQELMSIKAAMAYLSIKSGGAFAQALKNHSYLKDAVVEADDTYKRRIARSAIERYDIERKTGNSGSRDGMLWYAMQLRGDEVLEAAKVLSEHFGRQIEVGRKNPKVAKAESNGVEAEDEDTED